MYSDSCLVCGKDLQDVGLAYCSDECQNFDVISPSISSASSAFSSPQLGFEAGGEVPPLVPSALGNYGRPEHYAVSSSSASSASWGFTDDEDFEDSVADYISDGQPEFGSQPGGVLLPGQHSAISYARRPSGTNNPGKSGKQQRDLSQFSNAQAGHKGLRGMSRSVPMQHTISQSSFTSSDEEVYPRSASSSREDLAQTSTEKARVTEELKEPNPISLKKSKRSRNRASLPAYFSLLQLGETSPVANSSSSSNTIARMSPPTPRLTLSGAKPNVLQTVTAPPTPSYGTHATPRGRRKVVSHFRGDGSDSHSRERTVTSGPSSRSAVAQSPPREVNENSTEHLVDWAPSSVLPRGRAAVRRNSSPPPKMFRDAAHNQLANVFGTETSFLKTSHSSERRGRYRADEIVGTTSTDAPGLGVGRSGLMGREQSRPKNCGVLR